VSPGAYDGSDMWGEHEDAADGRHAPSPDFSLAIDRGNQSVLSLLPPLPPLPCLQLNGIIDCTALLTQRRSPPMDSR
jgi:hypothetical protein